MSDQILLSSSVHDSSYTIARLPSYTRFTRFLRPGSRPLAPYQWPRLRWHCPHRPFLPTSAWFCAASHSSWICRSCNVAQTKRRTDDLWTPRDTRRENQAEESRQFLSLFRFRYSLGTFLLLFLPLYFSPSLFSFFLFITHRLPSFCFAARREHESPYFAQRFSCALWWVLLWARWLGFVVREWEDVSWMNGFIKIVFWPGQWISVALVSDGNESCSLDIFVGILRSVVGSWMCSVSWHSSLKKEEKIK